MSVESELGIVDDVEDEATLERYRRCRHEWDRHNSGPTGGGRWYEVSVCPRCWQVKRRWLATC